MLNQTTWTGQVSHLWSEGANWTNGVPSMGVHAYIPKMDSSANAPLISTNLKVNFTLRNDGELCIDAILFVQRNGILQNYGTVKNNDISTITNQGNIMNFGIWINEGTLDNQRIFTNKHQFFNDGNLDNENTLVNMGSLINTGVIDNHKAINNSGTLENFNIIENHGTAEILDTGFFPDEFIFTPDEVLITNDHNIFANLITK